MAFALNGKLEALSAGGKAHYTCTDASRGFIAARGRVGPDPSIKSCPFFQAGCCRFGVRCWYPHDDAITANTAMVCQAQQADDVDILCPRGQRLAQLTHMQALCLDLVLDTLPIFPTDVSLFTVPGDTMFPCYGLVEPGSVVQGYPAQLSFDVFDMLPICPTETSLSTVPGDVIPFQWT